MEAGRDRVMALVGVRVEAGLGKLGTEEKMLN